jgi:O-antigen ligase
MLALVAVRRVSGRTMPTYREAMETVAARPATRSWSVLQRVDSAALATWALAGALVIYLGLDGGGYDLVVRSQVAIVVWWIVLVGAAWGVLPATRLTRAAMAALALLGGFVAWNALAATWSISSERTLQELSRVACYLGVFLLAVSIHRDRERAVRGTVHAVAAAIVLIAALALVSRLAPNSFPSSHATASFLRGTQARLGWPLNYWNGLAALIAVGLPLLLSIATSARRLLVQAAAAAALPVVALVGYLTFSRGGAIASGVAVLAFLALTPDRFSKLATMIVAAGGTAILIGGAVHRGAVEHGLANHLAAVQGRQLFVAIVLVSAGVALAQVGIGLAARHGTLPRLLQISPAHARGLLAAGVVVALIVAVAVGAPSRLSHAWHDFKVQRTSSQDLPGRFGSTAGNGRYDMWRVAVRATSGHVLGGSGPGTYQLLWEPRAPYYSYVINAHSLYVETLAEDGVIGLALLAGFFALVLAAAVRHSVRSKFETSTIAAGAAAALLAFAISAIADWTWQLPVLPVTFLLLGAAVLAPSSRRHRGMREPGGVGSRKVIRAGMILAALACLMAIGIPLATTNAVRSSQAAASANEPSLALSDARLATQIESGAASARVQEALVLEVERDLPAAIVAARQAIRDEPQNWTEWLVLSRLEAESGHPTSSISAFRRARSLNPQSPLFREQ